jgi:hypothetical protein
VRVALGRLRHDESGVVGGAEILPFGVLVFVFGSLLLVNAWSVIDGKLATSAAAREAARAFVESGGPADVALGEARLAAQEAFAGQRVNTASLQVTPVDGTVFERCAVATFEVRFQVPVVRVPGLEFSGATLDVASRHSELVDPYRSGVPGSGAGGAPC